MNDQQRAAMTMALEALHNTSNALLFVSADGYSVSKMAADAYDDAEKAITALREALAQPQDNLNCKSVQARLATSWGYVKAQQQDTDTMWWDSVEPKPKAQPQDHSEVLLTMVQCEWVDLTDDEIAKALNGATDSCDLFRGIRAVITKFKKKNALPVMPQVVTEGNASEVRSTDTGEPVAKVIRNEAGQIAMQKPDGSYFDMSKHIGQTFYTEPINLDQILHDPENQPSQHGTVPMEYVEAAIEATKEKAANTFNEQAKLFQIDYYVAQTIAAAIRSMK